VRNLLTESERNLLLRLARDTIAAALGGGPAGRHNGSAPADTRSAAAGSASASASAPAALDSPALMRPCGAFVTLTNRGRLRGCIGTFTARLPLCRTVQQMAQSVLGDPRFTDRPVTLAELTQLHIEISVLSPLEKVRDPLTEIELGRHGISIEGPWGSGCFLPQVATETGWSLEEFLSHCAAGKAGLPPDAWKDPSVSVYRFEAEVFGEKENSES